MNHDHSVSVQTTSYGVSTEVIQFPPYCAYHAKGRGDPHGGHTTLPSPTPCPANVLFVIPGNPGNARFYVPMAKMMRVARPLIGVVLVGFAGHGGGGQGCRTYSLNDQITMVHDLLKTFRNLWPSSAVSTAGHSVGAYIALEMVKRDVAVRHVFLLTPTIHSLATSPNGRQRSWALVPGVRHFFAVLLATLATLMPAALLLRLCSRHHNITDAYDGAAYTEAIASLLTYSRLLNVFTMGRTEMLHILSLHPGTDFITRVTGRVVFHFTPTDGWVPKENVAVCVDAFRRHKNVVFQHDDGPDPIPHDWCTGTATTRRVLEVAVLPYFDEE